MPQPGAGSQKLFKNSCTAGELSPRMVGRTDLKEYYRGLETVENFRLLPHGGLKRRNGTQFVREVKTSANSRGTILVPFAFSDVQEYILEFGDKYVRFYKDGGIIISGGNPVEVVTPYLFTDLPLLRFTQSADTLYIAHPNFQPRKLLRFSDSSWRLDVIDFIDGPYRDENIEISAKLEVDATTNPAPKTITLAANNGAGKIRITAAAHGYVSTNAVRIDRVLGTIEANGHWIITVIDANNFDLNGSTFTNAYIAGGRAILLSTMTASGVHDDGSNFAPFVAGGGSGGPVGGSEESLWRIKAVAVYGYVKLAFVKDSTHAWVDIRTNLDAASSPSSLWREGAWYAVRGYPATVTINAQRLVWANCNAEPQRLWASRALSYENYTPGTTDSDAWTYQIGDNKVNSIRWLVPVSRGMMVGSIGEEFLARGASQAGDITPTSIDIKPHTAYGSNLVPAVKIGQLTLFVTPSGLKVRQLDYQFAKDAYTAEDVTLLSEHITASGLVFMSWAPEPDSTLVCVRADGQLTSMMTYPEFEVKGWNRTITGGYKEATPEVIESIAVIHDVGKTRNEVWQVVKRTVNGATKRYVEFYTPDLHSDSATTADNTSTVATLTPGAATGNGVTFTASVAFFPNVTGDYIMTLPASAGGGRAVITAFVDTTHVVADIIEDFPSTAVIPAGKWGLGFNNFSGLTYLALRTVNLIGDGAVYPDVTVSAGGVVTVPAGNPPIVKVEIGIPFTAYAKTLRPDIGGSGGSIMLEKKRWGWIKARVQDTITLTVNGEEVAARTTADPLGQAITGGTGDISLQGATTGWDFDAQITLRQDKPVDTTIHALFGRLEVGGGQDD